MGRFCTNCGHPVQAGDSFCMNCGTKLQAAPTATTPAGLTAGEKERADKELRQAQEILLHPVLPDYRKAVAHLQYAAKHGQAAAVQNLAKLAQQYRKIQEFCQKELDQIPAGAGERLSVQPVETGKGAAGTAAADGARKPIALKPDAGAPAAPVGKPAENRGGNSILKNVAAGAAGAVVGSVLTNAIRDGAGTAGHHVAEAATPDIAGDLGDEAALDDAAMDALLDDLIIADALDNGVVDGSILEDPVPEPMGGGSETSLDAPEPAVPDTNSSEDNSSSDDEDGSISDFFSDLFN
ncbi:zinc ribbon domain-containing protein [uncultured Selenomonas sp.]|uniref:zinc ribbon domain-containing protein n=1 Tax=uncultured Selenomonas sp. TaxID=159275 RepID=UPI0025CEB264|nr:zinc ribbon domain-containing protein [uncultured Selenomonas sp.]